MSAWVEYRVEEIAAKRPYALATGPFGSAISSRFFETVGVPVLRGSNLSQDVGRRLVEDDFVFVSEEKAQEFKRSVATRGDLVFTCWGTIDQIGLVDERSTYKRYIVSNKQMKFTPDPARADSLFLYYLFSTPELQDQIVSCGIGSSVPGFNLGQLRAMKVNLPSLPEQKEIARMLGAIDDEIELNRRMNHTLENMASALFKSWFVDFDPVVAKAVGRKPFGMDNATAALFPDRLIETARDPIPKAWQEIELGTIVQVIDCLHSKKPQRLEAGLPLLQLCNIRDDGLIDMADTYFISESDYRLWTAKIEASPGDCVITNVGRVGVVAQIPGGIQAALGRNMTGIRPRESFPFPTFVVECLLSREMKEEIDAKTDTGTILNALNVRNIPKLRLVLGSTAVTKEFENRTRPLRARMERNHEESRTLTKLRDTLLPQLVAGDIRLDVAEKRVAELL